LKTLLRQLTILLVLGIHCFGAPLDKAADLEARLKETPEDSPAGAKLMLDLIDFYWQNGQVFGLIRTAGKFSRAQADHPRRAEIMLRLIDGYAATARHEDVITTGRQFLELFPSHALTNDARERLATAFERTGRVPSAATQYREIWQNGGAEAQGVRALKLLMAANNTPSFKQAATLAGEMVEKIPVDVTLTDVGFQGMEAAGRAEQWAEGLQIAKSLGRRKAPMNGDRQRELAYRTGQFESQLGQHSNAVQSFRKALSPDNADVNRSLISAMIYAKEAPSVIEAEARRYLAAFPRRDDRYEPLAHTAHAAAEAKNTPMALAISDEVMLHDVTSHEIPRNYAAWCGDDTRRAEQGLLKAIAKNPAGAATLRAVLALDVYRDRMKDSAKAAEMAREFLAKSPSEDGWTEEIIKFLYDGAPTDDAFRKNLECVVASAQAFPYLAGYQDRVWNSAPTDRNRNRDWQTARKNHQNDPTAKLWRQTREDGGKSGQACQELLEANPSPGNRLRLLARLAYVYRHHLGGKSKEVSAKHYETLCREAPLDLEAAARWTEAASLADQDMKVAAAQHLLTLPPADTSPDTWVRLCEIKNEAIIRKALPWIVSSSKESIYPLHYSSRIGDIMNELGMKAEAAAWWRSRMDLKPNDQEAVSCALRVAGTLDPAAAMAFLQPRLEADTDFQAAYAAEIASIAFNSGDFATMETVLSKSTARSAKTPFRSSGMGEWPARGWLEAARNNKDWSAEKKTRIYRIVRDLNLGRLSAEAGMELLADEPRTLDRLLHTQRLILMADPHDESWKRIYPFAQAAFAREDHALAACILNGLLNSIRSVGETEMNDARTLLRKAYARMGSMSADIPSDSPIAPLLQVILHLRLGENELAEKAYEQNRKLFDDHRAELPVELILFAAETHISLGTAKDHERAEDILRGWLIKFGAAENVDKRDKARIQLLLARNYQRAGQYDIARAEFTTVLNVYKDQPEAVNARFGIGETYMAQKVYDQAEEIFTDLAESPVPATSIRASFLRGVVALRQDNNEQARKIFLAVLENAPDADLANETLFNLAEVYGIEQRFLTQLETLRTVGRLGREIKLWHTPGTAISVVVQDTDLGISHGDSRIPVVVRTEPGNDQEDAFLTSGGAGKGIFLAEVPTILGVAKPKDGTLQVTGGDTITVDYPEDFKKQFQFEFLSNTRLRIASDGHLDAASSEIVNAEEATFTQTLKKEVATPDTAQPRSATRPKNQIKPGNLIYAQIKDGDRDLTANPDKAAIKLTASSGDEVQLGLEEQSQHGGIFQGTIRTGELPAGAKASDSALDHSPLMAIDHDPKTFWRSEPDGTAPKSISVDMKELRPVDTIVLTSSAADQEAPARMRVRASQDGRFWFGVGEFPAPKPAARVTFPNREMHLRIYKTPAKSLRENYTWDELADLIKKLEPDEDQKVDRLLWNAPEKSEDAYFLVWSGPLVQERDGCMRFGVSGKKTAIMLDGQLELPVGEGDRTVDVFARRGVHELTVISVATPGIKSVEALRARENRQSASISMRPFSAADFDLSASPNLPKVDVTPPPEIQQNTNHWTLNLPVRELRFVEFEFLEYRGEAVSISNIEVRGAGARHIPPAADVLELAHNQILELAPGDTVRVSYLDELTAGGQQRNRLLTKDLTATYDNGTITPISYDFARNGGGSVQGTRKELMRIEPGERIVAEVVDSDLDTGLERDTVEIEVQVNSEPPVKVTATETGPSTGAFTAEVDTAAESAKGKIVVKQGDKVYLRYLDKQNTFPGHAFQRETVVYLNQPTNGMVRILESEKPVTGPPRLIPVEGARPLDHVSKVEYRLPLTVEVIDPDQAKDTRSTVNVEVATSQGAKVRVECVLSRAFASPNETMDESRDPALFEGRFVGQIPLLLGGPDSTGSVPADGSPAKGGLGKVLPPTDQTSGDVPADGNLKAPAGMRVLNVIGTDTFTARYLDQARPDGAATPAQAKAALFSAATLRITDPEYLEDATIAHVGRKIFLLLDEPDRDSSDKRDKAMVRLVTVSGEDETVELEETLTHSGIFSGSLPLKATPKPATGNFAGEIECFFGDEITVGYLDNVPQTPAGLPIIEKMIPVAVGTDGDLTAFSKVFKDEDLAIQTQFHIAESYFELFKGHRKLNHTEEAAAELQSGRRVLRELHEDYPNPKYAPRISYLLGQFAQEMQSWNEAIAAYGSIVRNHPEHNLAPDAQYKLGQCFEEAGELDQALEAYVTLAATYPKSPLIANVMLRINEHFYQKEEYSVAAAVGGKFVERFPDHEWTPKMAFRIGQCHYKVDEFAKAGLAFDAFVKRFPDQELTSQALFWSGESYRMAKDIPNAFRRYNRCRWDFPESDAAKYSRGRLALPELLDQFEKEANLNE
jgi:TolA-binding protein